MESEGGSAVLYETETLEVKPDGTVDMDWKYMGPVYEMENQPMTYGTSWELPIIVPLTNEAGTLTKYIFMISPAPAGLADNKVYYFLGDFDVETGKFTPDESFDNDPALLDYGCNVFTGPSVFVDPQSGDTCVFSIMQDQRTGAEEGAAGWAEVGINARGLRMDWDVHTTLAMVHTYPDGDRDFSFYRSPGADMMLREDELDEKALENTRIFHFGTLSMTDPEVRKATKKAVGIAKESGAVISFDPNLRPPLWKSLDDAKEQTAYGLSQCDVLKISDNEIQWFTGEIEYDAGIRKLKE